MSHIFLSRYSFLLNSMCIVSGYIACAMYPRDWSWPDVDRDPASQWLAAFLVLATVSNLWTTSACIPRNMVLHDNPSMHTAALIIFLINRSNRNTLQRGDIPVAAQRGVVVTIIQSAMLYTLALFFLLVTFSADVNPEMFCIDALTPLIVRVRFPECATIQAHVRLQGISFTLIIVITGLRGWGGEEQKDNSSKTDEDGKSHAIQLRRLASASKKLRLATSTIASAFKPDDRDVHGEPDDQIYTPETRKNRLTVPKALPVSQL